MIAKKEKKKVLAVEDSPTQLMKLNEMLENNGFEVFSARNGEEALDVLKKFFPDMILSDVIMPKMDGYKLCSIIKKNLPWKDIPVVLLSALSDPEDILRGLDAGANSFLVKPYQEEHLMKQLSYILINHEMRKESQPEMGLQIFFAGKKQVITSDRLQIIDLLFSTFEAAIQRNRDLQRVNQTLINIQHELELKNKELSLLNEEKNKFLGIASHDLRNPLMVVKGCAEILLDEVAGVIDSAQKNFIQKIEESSNTMLRLINDFLDFSAIEAGKLNLNLQISDLNEVIQKNVELNQMTAAKRKIQIHFEPAELPKIMIDPERFEQVLYNIIGNAIKFSPQNKPIYIKTALDEKEKKVRIEIRDEGMGMSAEDLSRLFHPYERGKSASPHIKGTGLGLMIVRKIVDEHKGKIWVESTEGQGTTIFIELLQNLEKST